MGGDLNPPGGAVTGTMKTLEEVEPRIPIGAVTTPGDPNSTFHIGKSGSYYLTESVAGQAGKHGIEISASDVTIDLNGYTLDGGAGSFSGVYTGFGAGLENVVVVNGIVRGWIDGVDLSGVDGGRVVGVHTIGAGNTGIVLGRSMVARDCTSNDGAGHGFADQGGCRYSGCVARGNGFNGFISADESSLEGCVSEGNGASGFGGGFGCVWAGCTARENTVYGFAGSFASVISGCVSSANGDHGIVVASQCVVRDNDCAGNGTAVAMGAGIWTNGIDNRIDGNNCVGNDLGIDVATSDNLVVRNSASSNTSGNYDANITNTSADPSTAGAWDNLTY